VVIGAQLRLLAPEAKWLLSQWMLLWCHWQHCSFVVKPQLNRSLTPNHQRPARGWTGRTYRFCKSMVWCGWLASKKHWPKIEVKESENSTG